MERLSAGGISARNTGSRALMLSTTCTVLVPGWRRMARITPRIAVEPSHGMFGFDAVENAPQFFQAHRHAIAPSHDDGPVRGGVGQLSAANER